jgi:hypothetical protein
MLDSSVVVLTKRERNEALLAAMLANMPPEIALKRIIPTAQAAVFKGMSPRQWRREKAAGRTPPAVKIGVKAEGYYLCDLLAMNEESLETAK